MITESLKKKNIMKKIIVFGAIMFLIGLGFKAFKGFILYNFQSNNLVDNIRQKATVPCIDSLIEEINLNDTYSFDLTSLNCFKWDGLVFEERGFPAGHRDFNYIIYDINKPKSWSFDYMDGDRSWYYITFYNEGTISQNVLAVPKVLLGIDSLLKTDQINYKETVPKELCNFRVGYISQTFGDDEPMLFFNDK